MKTPSLILSCSLFLGVTQVDAQLGGDPTTPPNGAPVATMRSLDQIESRTPLVEGAPGVTVESNGGVTISQSGSYFLMGNIAITLGNAIEIDADNVTLDLNGFTISKSGGAGGAAVYSADSDNIHVTNGFVVSAYTYTPPTVTGTGFDYAVNTGWGSLNTAISYLNVVGCNDRITGYYGAEIVESCIGQYNKYGFSGNRVSNTYAEFIEEFAINGTTIINCVGKSNSGRGIQGTTVSDSYGRTTAQSATEHGISAVTVTNSRGSASDGHGIFVSNGTVTNSMGDSNAGNGIFVEDGTISHSMGN